MNDIEAQKTHDKESLFTCALIGSVTISVMTIVAMLLIKLQII
jgi:hypothetical protein